ncbi:hypothetical protein NECAME_11350 [Necator americanus]|uniref:Uncharacterized protein n=1 Tax=Necator americanus TaxID=51031 RepID=W2T5Y0_NECAM|nr:hypothetical protein NECAME_11350 [Necator americanus]ETN77029.1 hypothetical protein NECAME_11350 [Necator americanus]
MKVTHVIFDFDGLLVDTEPCVKIVHTKLLSRYDRVYTPEIASHVMGRKEVESISWLLKEAWRTLLLITRNNY